MRRRPSFIRTLLWNQILWLIPMLTAMMSPVLFMAGIGIWGLFSEHERFFWFWDWFWLHSLGAFLAVWLICLGVRQWRLPRRATAEREAAARREVESFVQDFPYDKLTFSNWQNILDAILELNARVARVYGIRSRNPELDIPLSCALLLIDRISADLTQKLAEFRTGDLTQKLAGVRIGDQPLLDWVKLSHLLWFMPSASRKKVDQNASGGWFGMGKKSTSVPAAEGQPLNSRVDGGAGEEVPDANSARSSRGLRAQGMRYAVRKIFPVLFQIVGDYSVLLYGGKFQAEPQETDPPPMTASSRVVKPFVSETGFFHSRLATPQWMAVLYACALGVCLVVGGVLFPLEKTSSPVSQTSEIEAGESISGELNAIGERNASALDPAELAFSVPEMISEESTVSDAESMPSLERLETKPFTRAWTLQIVQKHGLVILAALAALGVIFFWLKDRACLPILNVEPDARWMKKERNAFLQVQKMVDSLHVEELEGILPLFRAVRRIVELVDQEYSGKTKPAYSISLAELLQAQRILVGRLQKMLARELPGMEYLRLRDLRFGLKVYGFYVWTFGVYRKVLWFDPVAAGVLEIRRTINQSILKFYSRQLGVGAALYALELAGFYAVEIYSGHLFWKGEQAGPIRIGVWELTSGCLRKREFQETGEFGLTEPSAFPAETEIFSDFIPKTDADGWNVEPFRVAKNSWTNFVPFRNLLRETESGSEPSHADVLVLLSQSTVTPAEKVSEEKSLSVFREFWENQEAKPLVVRIQYGRSAAENAGAARGKFESGPALPSQPEESQPKEFRSKESQPEEFRSKESQSDASRPEEDGKALAEQGNAPLPVEKKESGLPAERQSSRWGLGFFSTMANWLNRSQGSKISASEEPERIPSALSDSDWLKDAGPLWNWEQDPDTARGLREIFERFLLENREKIQLSQERRFLTAYRSRHRR